jgi:hypothetical protein
VPQPAQAGHVLVGDPGRGQRFRQNVAIELRVVTGTRHRPHIDHARHRMSAKQVDKFLD